MMIVVLAKIIMYVILGHEIVSVIRQSENEILNATETLVNN